MCSRRFPTRKCKVINALQTKYMPIVHSNTIQITPITGRIRNTIPETTNTKEHCWYSSTIFELHFLTFSTLFFRLLSPDQKLIGTWILLASSEIIKNGNAHKRQHTKPIILPIMFTSANADLANTQLRKGNSLMVWKGNFVQNPLQLCDEHAVIGDWNACVLSLPHT